MSGFSLERPIVMHALVVSFIISAIFVTLITILGELVIVGDAKVIKNWLADTHGHHWVGKGIWTLILFVVFGFISYLSIKIKHNPVSPKLVYWAGYTAIAAAVLMTVFFIYEYVVLH